MIDEGRGEDRESDGQDAGRVGDGRGLVLEEDRRELQHAQDGNGIHDAGESQEPKHLPAARTQECGRKQGRDKSPGVACEQWHQEPREGEQGVDRLRDVYQEPRACASSLCRHRQYEGIVAALALPCQRQGGYR